MEAMRGLTEPYSPAYLSALSKAFPKLPRDDDSTVSVAAILYRYGNDDGKRYLHERLLRHHYDAASIFTSAHEESELPYILDLLTLARPLATGPIAGYKSPGYMIARMLPFWKTAEVTDGYVKGLASFPWSVYYAATCAGAGRSDVAAQLQKVYHSAPLTSRSAIYAAIGLVHLSGPDADIILHDLSKTIANGNPSVGHSDGSDRTRDDMLTDILDAAATVGEARLGPDIAQLIDVYCAQKEGVTHTNEILISDEVAVYAAEVLATLHYSAGLSSTIVLLRTVAETNINLSYWTRAARSALALGAGDETVSAIMGTDWMVRTREIQHLKLLPEQFMPPFRFNPYLHGSP